MAPRSVAKDVTISMGLVSTKVSLFPVANTEEAKETKTSLVCPDCKDDSVAKMEQFYIGSCGHHPPNEPKGFKTGECAKGVPAGEGWKRVDATALEEAKASDLEKNLMEVLVRPAAEVDRQTWPSGVSYWCEAGKGGEKPLTVLAELAGSQDFALLGLMVMRGQERLYRLRPLNGGLVLQQVLRPNEMHQFTASPVELSEKERATLSTVAEMSVEDFDPLAFRSQTIDRLRAVLAEVAGTEASVTSLPAASPKSGDVMDQLEAMLAAAKSKKDAA